MWKFIAEEVNSGLKISISAQHVENRFKTILKRKKKASLLNNKTGADRTVIEFENELNKIVNKDDSIQPEVMKDQSQQIYKPKTKAEKSFIINGCS